MINDQGHPAWTAKPIDIDRHVHAKVTTADKDNGTAANISTNIKYLDLADTRNRPQPTPTKEELR